MVKVALVSLAVLVCADGLGDLQRARTKVPRDEYRADHSYRMGKTLNGHLKRSHPNVKPCHKWTVSELQELQHELHKHREAEHNSIYSTTKDTRAMRFSKIEEYVAHWDDITRTAADQPRLVEMQRDGHCLEAVMWWVHHLTEATQKELKHLAIPSLPLVEWRKPTEEEGAAASKVHSKHYDPSATCLACHGGGIPWQNPDTMPPPFPRQVNGKDRQRRCDEYYNEEDGLCGGCDGIAGAYYGDLPDHGIYVDDCVVVNKTVPEADRAPNSWPHAFSVEMRGADRWPRASPSGNASCNFTTDCSPYNKDAEGVPLPPSVPFHWYAAIHGVLYLDHNPGQFGGGRLRHETVYQFPSGKEGAEHALKGFNGERNVHLTEIHVQTPEMGKVGNPGVMLNLEHKNMTAANASGIDDSKLDWRRIPSTDGQCVCVPNPAGLPDFMDAYNNATYMGRVQFTPPWQTTGTGGLPDGKKVVADHWVKWVFHLFVDIDTKKPVMFSSPFGGCATYGNWSMPDDMWPGWRENPPKPNCFDVTGNENCHPYVGSGASNSLLV